MNKEKIVNKLIKHIKKFGYWSDCVIYFNGKCWSDYEIGYFDKSAVFVEKIEDVYIHTISNCYSGGMDVVIHLLGRGGGLLYRDGENPLLCDLPLKVQEYMINHQDMYHGYNYGVADGNVALFALEEILFKNGVVIVDWSFDDNGNEIITIADISLETIKRRDIRFASFKKRIGYYF